MQHGLAVEADDVDRRRVDRILAQELLDGFGVPVGDHALGEGEHAGAGVAVFQRAGLGEGAAQQRAVGVGIGIVVRRPERERGLAVGLDERDVDAVHRGAGHQSDRAI